MKTAQFSRLLIIIISPLIYLLLPSKASAAWSVSCVAPQDHEVATLRGITCLIENLLSNALKFVGLATFIVIIIGGFKILTSGSDVKATESGKQTITMGIIGLALAVGAWFVLLAIQNFTGIGGLTRFDIPQ